MGDKLTPQQTCAALNKMGFGDRTDWVTQVFGTGFEFVSHRTMQRPRKALLLDAGRAIVEGERAKAELVALKERLAQPCESCEALRAQLNDSRNAELLLEWQRTAQRYRKQIESLRAALHTYADEDSWTIAGPYPKPLHGEKPWMVAREALLRADDDIG